MCRRLGALVEWQGFLSSQRVFVVYAILVDDVLVDDVLGREI
jgi:hypothetical protein